MLRLSGRLLLVPTEHSLRQARKQSFRHPLIGKYSKAHYSLTSWLSWGKSTEITKNTIDSTGINNNAVPLTNLNESFVVPNIDGGALKMTSFDSVFNPSLLNEVSNNAILSAPSSNSPGFFTGVCEQATSWLPMVWEIEQYGLGGPGIRAGIQYGVESLHHFGLPWWAAIPTGVLILRALLFPAVVSSTRSTNNMQTIRGDIQKLQAEMKSHIGQHDRLALAASRKKLRDLMAKNNVKPLRSVLVLLVQIPVLYCFFMAMQDMASSGMTSLNSGGFGWVTDLTSYDPYFILPLFNAGMIVSGAFFTSRSNPNINMSIMKPAIYGMAVISVPMSYLFPLTVQLYFMAQTTLHCLTQMLFCWMPFRRLVGMKDIAPLPADQKPNDPITAVHNWVQATFDSIEKRQKKIAQRNAEAERSNH